MKEIGMLLTVKQCLRCGGDHDNLEFKELARPSDRFSMYATCPGNGEPIMIALGGGHFPNTMAMKAKPVDVLAAIEREAQDGTRTHEERMHAILHIARGAFS